jgi:alpha-galactosidase
LRIDAVAAEAHMKSYSSVEATFARLLVLGIMLWLATPGYTQTKFSATQRGQRNRPASSRSSVIAATPPMGWNSWDSYSRTLDEQSIKANARWLARNLKRFGWEYVVVDEGWYLANLDPRGDASQARFQMDEFGRYVSRAPRVSLRPERIFPSAPSRTIYILWV